MLNPNSEESPMPEYVPMTDEQLFAYGLLQMAQDLRMQANGSADPWPPEGVKQVVDYIRSRQDAWELRRRAGKVYDDAVYDLLSAALHEVETC